MKKLTLCLMAAFLLLSVAPLQLNAATQTITSQYASKPIETAESTALRARLDEISQLDKSNMSFSEKRQLRKEVRSTKSQLRQIGGGVYISAGVLILIIVLVIILL